MTPSVGQIVHYCGYDGETQPAIVAKINEDGTVNLAVFDPGGRCLGVVDVKYSKEWKFDTWHPIGEP